MNVLIDTNILTRLAQPGRASHSSALAALDTLRASGDRICVVPQNLYEFWVVCTRPEAENGLGMTPIQAHLELTQLKSLFVLLPDSAGLFEQWERLVTSYGVRGKNAHDARLVAAMLTHNVGHILTFNPEDFARYPMITVLTPEQAAGSTTTQTDSE
ncbi:MAG: type II toxin-antitoxin system VapC family toxin [Phycisphaerae bacterium]|jgi:predicted nucleic acid-binding protein|nr:type II toxin-antitoxin system VapC family toxin [Phycisphaerae bacterium]